MRLRKRGRLQGMGGRRNLQMSDSQIVEAAVKGTDKPCSSHPAIYTKITFF
jgi:hypothetical protein